MCRWPCWPGEGLRAYCDAVVGGRRLRQATWWSLIFTLTGAVVGLCLTFYLTSMAAFASLTTLNFLVFMLSWLVPGSSLQTGSTNAKGLSSLTSFFRPQCVYPFALTGRIAQFVHFTSCISLSMRLYCGH